MATALILGESRGELFDDETDDEIQENESTDITDHHLLTEEDDSESSLCVVSFGEKYNYRIPSFSVLLIELRHAVIQKVNDSDQLELFDVFFRDDTSLNVQTPILVQPRETCFVDINEFSLEISLPSVNFLDGAVFIIWKWNFEIKSNEIYCSVPDACSNHDLFSESDENIHDQENEIDNSSNDDDDYSAISAAKFKCIGATRDLQFQARLKSARDRIESGYIVQARLNPEPQNIYDSQAISFECLIDNKWQKIGYAVREVLDALHEAINNKDIVSVEFAWIKYISDWKRSGPGYFAGIQIVKKGTWSKEVMKHQSTR